MEPTGGKPMSLNMAMKHFFGMLPGTGLKDFLEETKKLTPKDKEEIRDGLVANGYVIVEQA